MLPHSLRHLRFALLPAACALVGCGAQHPDTGTTSDALAAGALAGTWDVVGSDADGLTRSGTITIGKTSLTVSFGDYVLRFNDDPAGATTLLEDSSEGPAVT